MYYDEFSPCTNIIRLINQLSLKASAWFKSTLVTFLLSRFHPKRRSEISIGVGDCTTHHVMTGLERR